MTDYLDEEGLEVVVDAMKAYADNTLGNGGSSVEYGLATATNDGLMSSSDFTKLQSIEDGAQVNTIETVQFNGSVINPVNGKINLNTGVGVFYDYEVYPLIGPLYSCTTTTPSIGHFKFKCTSFDLPKLSTRWAVFCFRDSYNVSELFAQVHLHVKGNESTSCSLYLNGNVNGSSIADTPYNDKYKFLNSNSTIMERFIKKSEHTKEIINIEESFFIEDTAKFNSYHYIVLSLVSTESIIIMPSSYISVYYAKQSDL